MFAHRISVVLCSVLLVAVSVFAVKMLLFAQNEWGGEICMSGKLIADTTGPTQTGGNAFNPTFTTTTTEPHGDAACEAHDCPGPPCSTVSEGGYPKEKKTVIVAEMELIGFENGLPVYRELSSSTTINQSGYYDTCP